jgi:hypothetical protein
MRVLFVSLMLSIAARSAAEIQFVGAMITSNQKLFALRAHDGAPSRWLTVGDSIEGFCHYGLRS